MVLQRMQKAFQEFVARFRSDKQRQASTQSRSLGSPERNLIEPILPRPPSPLFSRFPLEIRQQIYSLALGGNMLHVLPNGIREHWRDYDRCLPDHDMNWHTCRLDPPDCYYYMRCRDTARANARLLGLLLTCRQVSVFFFPCYNLARLTFEQLFRSCRLFVY
jgi:hypothetical protein